MAASKQQLRDFIGGLESGGNYNAYYGNSANTEVDFTQMTVAEVRQWQRDQVASGAKSAAVGKYQVVGKTLKRLISAGVVSPSDKFDAATQDKLADHLLDERGYQSFAAGNTSADAFGNSLAKEWASLPVLTGSGAGKSYYEGDGLNRSLTSTGAVLSALNGHPTPEGYIPETAVGSVRDVRPRNSSGSPDERQDYVNGVNGMKRLPAPDPLQAQASTVLRPASHIAGSAVQAVLGVAPVTEAQTRAEQRMAVAAASRARSQTVSVVGQGKSIAQIGQEADNVRLNGYRSIQEMGPSSGGGGSQSSSGSGQPAPKSGSQAVKTVYVRPDGTERTVAQAGSVQLGSLNASGSPDDRQHIVASKGVSYEVANPAYAAWVRQYGGGKQNVSGSPDDRDGRPGGVAVAGMAGAGGVVPAAPPKTVTMTKVIAVNAAVSGSRSPSPAPIATVKGTATGKAYVVGSTVEGSGGRNLTVQADGSFKNAATGQVSAGSSGKRYALLEESGVYG